MNITLNAKINDLQSQLNTKMSKGKLQISAIQEKLGKVEEDSTQLRATIIENAKELEVQIEELRESVAWLEAKPTFPPSNCSVQSIWSQWPGS